MMEAIDDVKAGQDPNAVSDVQSKWSKPKAYDYTTMDGPERNDVYEGNAQVYEWDGEEGDIGPEHPQLELELFGTPEDRAEVKGLDFSAYVYLLCHAISEVSFDLGLYRISEISVIQEGPVKIDLVQSFRDAGLHPAMHRNIQLAGYEAPTPIQKCTLPSIHMGYDTIGIAQTGLSLIFSDLVVSLLPL